MLETDKRIKLIQNKVAETERIFKKDQDSLGELSDKLVKLIADNMIKPSGQKKKEIEGITGQIGELKNKIELSPKIIEALKNKIVSLEKERSDQILQGKIEEQKAIGSELAKISKSFIGNLKKAKEENSKIQSLWVSWRGLSEETNLTQFKDRVSLGSQEMLGIVSGILIGEFEKGIIRKQSVFNRIRL